MTINWSPAIFVTERGKTQGTGFHAGEIVTCGTCGGSGYITRQRVKSYQEIYDIVRGGFGF